MGVPELIIGVIAVTVAVSAIRALRPRVRPETPLTSDLRSHLRMLTMRGRDDQAIKELRELTGFGRRDAKIAMEAIINGDPPVSGYHVP